MNIHSAESSPRNFANSNDSSSSNNSPSSHRLAASTRRRSNSNNKQIKVTTVESLIDHMAHIREGTISRTKKKFPSMDCEDELYLDTSTPTSPTSLPYERRLDSKSITAMGPLSSHDYSMSNSMGETPDMADQGEDGENEVSGDNALDEHHRIKRREMERVKKAKWRAKKKEKESSKHQFDIPYLDLPPMVWQQIKKDFGIEVPLQSSPIDDGTAIVSLLDSIGYEWNNRGVITRAPDPMFGEELTYGR